MTALSSEKMIDTAMKLDGHRTLSGVLIGNLLALQVKAQEISVPDALSQTTKHAPSYFSEPFLIAISSSYEHWLEATTWIFKNHKKTATFITREPTECSHSLERITDNLLQNKLDKLTSNEQFVYDHFFKKWNTKEHWRQIKYRNRAAVRPFIEKMISAADQAPSVFSKSEWFSFWLLANLDSNDHQFFNIDLKNDKPLGLLMEICRNGKLPEGETPASVMTFILNISNPEKITERVQLFLEHNPTLTGEQWQRESGSRLKRLSPEIISLVEQHFLTHVACMKTEPTKRKAL
jgi:hypothetical protein